MNFNLYYLVASSIMFLKNSLYFRNITNQLTIKIKAWHSSKAERLECLYVICKFSNTSFHFHVADFSVREHSVVWMCVKLTVADFIMHEEQL